MSLGAEDRVDKTALIFREVVEAYHYVSRHAHIIEETDVLEGSRYSLLIDDVLRVPLELLSVQEERTGRGLIYAREHIKYGRLARTVRADKSVYLFFLYAEIATVNRLKTAEGDAEIFSFKY